MTDASTFAGLKVLGSLSKLTTDRRIVLKEIIIIRITKKGYTVKTLIWTDKHKFWSRLLCITTLAILNIV